MSVDQSRVIVPLFAKDGVNKKSIVGDNITFAVYKAKRQNGTMFTMECAENVPVQLRTSSATSTKPNSAYYCYQIENDSNYRENKFYCWQTQLEETLAKYTKTGQSSDPVTNCATTTTSNNNNNYNITQQILTRLDNIETLINQLIEQTKQQDCDVECSQRLNFN